MVACRTTLNLNLRLNLSEKLLNSKIARSSFAKVTVEDYIMNFLLFSLGGALVSLFAFFLIRSLGMHGWSTNKKSVMATGLLSAFTMNLFLFQTMFAEKSLHYQLLISIILSSAISVSFYFVSREHISTLLTRLLLLNAILTGVITLSLVETFEAIPEPGDSFTFDNLSLAYQLPSIAVIFFLIYFFEKKIFKIVSKNKNMYIIYNLLFFILGLAILFWPVDAFYIQFLTLPFALLLGYIGFCFATHMFAHHARHNQ